MQAWIARNRWFVGLGVVLVAALIVLVIVVADDDDSTTAPTTATPSTTSTTSVPSTTATTASPPTTAPFDPITAVWPYASGTTRYTDPVAAATGFATDFVDFAAPVVSKFRAGDARSGEVDVQARGDGPITTVLVRQLGSDDTWWVLGATTANIELSEPAAGAVVSSPVRLRGRSTAFEGTVQAEVRQDGAVEPIGAGFVTGGSSSELEPFDGSLAFTTPTAASGAVVLYTVSMENGQVWEAAVVRVRFE